MRVVSMSHRSSHRVMFPRREAPKPRPMGAPLRVGEGGGDGGGEGDVGGVGLDWTINRVGVEVLR